MGCTQSTKMRFEFLLRIGKFPDSNVGSKAGYFNRSVTNMLVFNTSKVAHTFFTVCPNRSRHRVCILKALLFKNSLPTRNYARSGVLRAFLLKVRSSGVWPCVFGAQFATFRGHSSMLGRHCEGLKRTELAQNTRFSSPCCQKRKSLTVQYFMCVSLEAFWGVGIPLTVFFFVVRLNSTQTGYQAPLWPGILHTW